MTTGWVALLTDVAPLRAIFGDKLPDLDDIDIHEIILKRDGPTALLKFDLKQFPDHPPKKWLAAGLNRVQVQLLAVDVQAILISGWLSNYRTSLRIFSEDGLVCIKSLVGEASIEIASKYLIVDGVSAYRE